MANYVKTTDFAVKDSADLILGNEWNVEFDAIQDSLESKGNIVAGQVPVTTNNPGTIDKALYPNIYTLPGIPDLTIHGNKAAVGATAPSASETIVGPTNLTVGQLQPLFMAQGPSSVSVESGADFLVSGTPVGTTSLLLHFDGSAGQKVFTDSSGNNVDVTFSADYVALGNNPKFGPTGCTFQGGGGTLFIDVAEGDNFDLRDGSDFTVEGWFYSEEPETFNGDILMDFSNHFNTLFRLRVQNYNFEANVYNDGASSSHSSAIVANTWYHFAYERYQDTLCLYLNGERDDNYPAAISGTWAGTFGANPIYIGAGYLSDSQGTYFGGSMDEIRITKGQAVYKGPFTPPAAPFPNGQATGFLDAGTGTTGLIPHAELLKVGTKTYIIPDQHSVDEGSTAHTWVAA
jgi:hypothetical protein